MCACVCACACAVCVCLFFSRLGHASVMHEIHRQLPSGLKPSLVSVAVGGGGLLCGVMEGMHHPDIGWTDVPVVAVETKGADSFAAAAEKGEVVTLDAITRY